MKHFALKIAAVTSVAMLASAGSAYAEDGKNCDHNKKVAQTSAMTTEAVAGQTAVLGASEKNANDEKDSQDPEF